MEEESRSRREDPQDETEQDLRSNEKRGKEGAFFSKVNLTCTCKDFL